MTRAVTRAALRALVLVGLCLALVACGGEEAVTEAPETGFAGVAAEARGQTVRWWMFGGDPAINRYVERYVVPAAARRGVRLRRVPVTDTADAVNRVVAERRAGETDGGAVDLVWINGENFAAGKRAGLWLEDWVDRLPNARLVALRAPIVARDFQVPVDGQEAPWSRAAFVFAHDSVRVPAPPRGLPALAAYARANPGRITYPAPPDFTGSAFVRQVVQRLGSQERGLAYLRELAPHLWRGGRVYPKSEQELSDLFADGQVDLAMSYDASFIARAVRQGRFPESARPFLIGDGALQNTSYVTIPANAANPEGAQVVADLLLAPRLQAAKQDPGILGVLTVLDVARLPPTERRRFDRESGPYLLRSLGTPLGELPADRVEPIERAWTREVLR